MFGALFFNGELFKRVITIIISFFVEHLDFMNTVDTSEMTFQQFHQLEHEYIGYQSLTDVPRALQYTEDPKTYQVCASLY